MAGFEFGYSKVKTHNLHFYRLSQDFVDKICSFLTLLVEINKKSIINVLNADCQFFLITNFKSNLFW